MAKLSVCVEMLLTEYPFMERITRAAELGFPAVEFWFTGQNPDDPAAEDKAFAEIGDACRKAGIAVSAFVINSPDGSVTGSLVEPGDRKRYLKRLERLVELAKIIDCSTIITCTGNELPNRTREEQVRSVVEALRAAAPIAQAGGITLVVEPLNTLVDHAGYFLDSSALGTDIIRKVSHPNVKLLYDVYHMQVMEGNIISNIRENIDIIGHFHSAGVPGRHELTSGELNYHEIIAEVDCLGYDRYFGLEYTPLLDSRTSLRLTKESLLS